jgi:outer membrane protein assembly factor BamE (lipoprotein component of BamABCDE complex)
MRKIYVLALIMLASCASIGPDYDQAAANKIKTGMSQEEVLGLLGQPTTTANNDKGIVVMQWTHGEASAFGAVTARSIQVIFDKSGKVTTVSQSSVN